MLAIVLILLLTGCSIALMAQGDVAGAGILVLLLTSVVAIRVGPFETLPVPRRRAARLAATGTVLAGWVVGGATMWDWDGRQYAAAGVFALVALARAAWPPPAPRRT